MKREDIQALPPILRAQEERIYKGQPEPESPMIIWVLSILLFIIIGVLLFFIF